MKAKIKDAQAKMHDNEVNITRTFTIKFDDNADFELVTSKDVLTKGEEVLVITKYSEFNGFFSGYRGNKDFVSVTIKMGYPEETTAEQLAEFLKNAPVALIPSNEIILTLKKKIIPMNPIIDDEVQKYLKEKEEAELAFIIHRKHKLDFEGNKKLLPLATFILFVLVVGACYALTSLTSLIYPKSQVPEIFRIILSAVVGIFVAYKAHCASKKDINTTMKRYYELMEKHVQNYNKQTI